MAARYFKPRDDVPDRHVLLPQKVEASPGGLQQYRWSSGRWIPNHGWPDWTLLKANFTSVQSEAEATGGYR